MKAMAGSESLKSLKVAASSFWVELRSLQVFRESESFPSDPLLYDGFAHLRFDGSQQYRAPTVPGLTQQMFDACVPLVPDTDVVERLRHNLEALIHVIARGLVITTFLLLRCMAPELRSAGLLLRTRSMTR